MKFGKVGQVVLVSAIALVVATLFTACGAISGATLTVGFLFVATNKQTPGQIEVYEVNSQSGGLRTIPTSPFPSGGRDPIAEAVSPDAKNLYVVNEDDNNIVQFSIGTDGKLYPQATVNTPGSFPLAVAVNPAGTFLYVIDTLQPTAGCTLTNPCPGDIAVYPLDKTTGALGAAITNNTQYPNFWPLLVSPADSSTVLTPTALQVLPNGNNVYITAYNAATNAGYLFEYTANSDGTLTQLHGGAPINLGSQPVAMAADTGSAYLYVADKLANKIDSFAVQSGGTLSLQGATPTGGLPSALTLFNDQYLYAANSGDSTVSTYSVSSGTLTKLADSTSDTQPIAITVDPRKLGFLYTVNFLGNSLSGYKIDTSTGALINAEHSPFPSSVQPTAIAGIPHNGTVTK